MRSFGTLRLMIMGRPLESASPYQQKGVLGYGHDQDSRHQREAMLRRWRLESLIFDQLPSRGHTIIKKL